ncbi:MAG: GDP-mannose 4,6-dehydratase [Polynucleobacter sp.]|nr:GDP-mannose 4,6-dehydratase [Polynucleobacter sp.]
MSQKVALICGVSGQDGSYLASLLLSKGYKVFGTSRDVQGSGFLNLLRLGIKEQIQYISMLPEDLTSVLQVLRNSNPDEIYYLAGQSSVGLSFERPAEAIQSITLGTLNMLEGCRVMDKKIKLYQAGSGECFGDTQGKPANELTPFLPMSPYAVAKSSAYWLVNNYRDSYGLFACTGILFNHESPLRPECFVTQKIIHAVKRIAQGSNEKLKLGRLDIARDWGWASEYVDAMWRMLQQDHAQDYVIATGTTITLEEFVKAAFDEANLNWQDYVIQDPSLFRPTDLAIGCADPSKAANALHWKASTQGVDVVKKMYQSI